MKFVIIGFLCLYIPTILCMSDEMIEMIATLHKTCVEETGVDEAVIDKVNVDKAIPSDDPKLKCYMKCLIAQTGCVSDDGVIDIDCVVSVMPEEIKDVTEPVIRGCGVKKGADACDSAYIGHQCFITTKPDIYKLI